MDNELTVDDVASMGEDDSATMLQDFIKYGAYAPIGDSEQVQEFAEGGEVTGDSLFGTFPEREAAANAYTNPIITQPAVGPAPVAQQPVSVPTALTTPPLPTALSTMQQPQGSPTTTGFAPVATGAATTLSAADMLQNIPTFASTKLTMPTSAVTDTPTLAKPVLKELKDLPAQQINLAPSDILTSYGTKTTGEATTRTEPTVVSFDRPQDFAAYLTPDGIDKSTTTTGGTTGGGSAPAVLKTPGGYEYTNYQNFDPNMISGTKAQVTDLFAGVTKQQQSEADAIRGEYKKAVSVGNWGLAGQLNDLLKEQEADVLRSKADFTAASKYFTGVGGAYELPNAYRSRREADWLKNQGVTGYTDVDLGGIKFTPETKADPFTQALTTQQKEYIAANSLYGDLSKLYGKDSEIAKNYFNDVVTPQKQQYDDLNKLAAGYTKANLYGMINTFAASKPYVPPKLAITTKTTETGLNKTFSAPITTYSTNIKNLENAIGVANNLGLGGYAERLDQLLGLERDKLNLAVDTRNNYIGQIPGRATGSPPEGEISNPVARMVAQQSRSKNQGMDSKSKAMLKKFAGGGEAVASSSPTSQEFPLNEQLYATGEARSLESTELPLIGKVARFMQTEERKPSARRNPREDITKTDMGAESKEAMDWIADKLFGRTAIGKTAENIAQGMPLTYGTGMARTMYPDTKEALMGAAGLVTPAGAKAAKEGVEIVAQGAKKAGKKALKELGPAVAEKAMKYAPAAQPMYVVKPGGGTFFPEGSGSNLDTYLDKVVKQLSATPEASNIPGKDAQAIADFIRKKGRKYFTSEYGTADDTLRTALLEGRLPTFGRDKERFRQYMIKAARGKGTPVGAAQEGEDAGVAMRRSMGDPEAMIDLEKAYDSSTGLNNYMFPEADATNIWDQQLARMNATKRKLTEMGVPPELQNVDFPTAIKESNRNLSSTSDAAKSILKFREDADIAAKRAQVSEELGLPPYTAPTPELDKSLQYALKTDEPIYDVDTPRMDFLSPSNVAQGIATIPLKDLNRMSFAEAVIKGQKNTKLERDWQEVVEKAKKGNLLPRKIYMEGTQPIYEVSPNERWVRVTTPDAVQLEGAAMNHSVGGYKTDASYGKGGKEAFNSGATRVYSLRSEKGKPAVTVESTWDKDNGLSITQIKGKFNSEPNQQEKQAIFELFDVLGPKKIHRSESYGRTREGDILPSESVTQVEWAKLYDDYLANKNQ